ncbi:uncharacterized protein PFL1_05383 [Pseudozyma flocculosa PF-1]|uniref:Protein kinase domain-containing protein n=2 Tax=Pseudozyma flocculosa TaxID=84751 RepID=A0A5C3FA59_9BASI|nr:uncharacterized protein PFL1_05383 [Pseudozyma flocculosa PF-1]EPQ27099.1 hypothetical protein PFL1_05383 [Pseudozyma flocculosa PF-1]SPO41333.1 uncharacterized protein PSFLO_06815 [Pseudozyma flocculosa]
MTAISRTNMPPATPVHLGAASLANTLKRDHATSIATPNQRSHHHLTDLSPTQDSPLPPAPVSAFIIDDEPHADANLRRTAAAATAAATNPTAAPSSSRQAIGSRTRTAVSRITRERPPISDEDSPGVGRRAAAGPSSTSPLLDDLGVPRASYLLQSERARISVSRSSPVFKGEDHLDHAAYLDRKSSPASNQPILPSGRTAQATGSRYRSSHAPISSAAFGKAGESSRPTYGGLGRSSSYGNGNNSVEAVRDDARIASRSSMNSIAGDSGIEARASRPEPFNRRMSRTPPSELRGQAAAPKRRSFEAVGDDLDLGARPLPSSHDLDFAPSGSASGPGSRTSSRNSYARPDEAHDMGSLDMAPHRVARRTSDESETATELARPRLSAERFDHEHIDVETARASSFHRSQSPPPAPSSPDARHVRTGSAADAELHGALPDRSPPGMAARFRASTEARGDGVIEGPGAAAGSGYRTPALGNRALRSSLAASNGARSAGRSLRKLARSSNHHVPARRVQRYQDEEEDEDLDDDAKDGNKGEHENGGSGNNSSGEGPDAGQEGVHASGGSSGSGSREERGNVSPRLRAYGYDPVEAKSRAELLERASLVRSPSPKPSLADPRAVDRDDDGEANHNMASATPSPPPLQPPPPSKKEQHPNARRAATGDNAGRKENIEPAGRKRGAGANAIHDILAAKIPAPNAQAAAGGVRRHLPPSSADSAVPVRSAFAPSAAQNQAKAGAAPLVPSTVPPPPPEGMAEGDDEIDEEVYRQYSDCRPDLIWGEADRQHEQPLASHANLLELVKGPPKATAMQGLKYRKVKKAGRGGFSVVWVVRGPLYEPSAASPQDFEEVPEDRQAFFALKQVSLKEVESEQNRQELISEANTLRTLANLEGSEKYLLRYFGHRVSNDKLKILLELGDGDFNGILATQAPLSRDLIAHYWREMLEAVQFIHDVNLVHTDLKPANFLIVKNRIKLIDFGIAQNIPKGTVHISRDAIIGTPNYMAPEAIKIAKAKGRRVYKAGKPSDVWSLGCILYQMIWGRPPFDKLPSDRKLEGIMDPNHKIAYTPYRDPRYPDVEDVDADLLDCVRSALQYRVEDRATIPQLLQHPFLRRPDDGGDAEAHDDDDDEDLDETVSISRGKLRDLVGRLRTLALRDELTEDNVIERADMLFNNLKQAQAQS